MAGEASTSWFKMLRTEEALELMRNPFTFTLLALIAYRAQRTEAFNIHGLAPGQAFIGDHKACGLSEQQYRTAKAKHSDWRFATFKSTNKGTIATLTDTRVFDINAETINGQINSPATVQQQSSNDYQEVKNDKNVRSLQQRAKKELSKNHREIAVVFESALKDQWVNDAGKWINRIKMKEGKARSIAAELNDAIKHDRIKTTPAQYAEQLWKEFK